MEGDIEKRISGVKNWLILNSGAVPFVVAYVLRQMTQGSYKRYPKNYPLSFGGIRMTDGGRRGQYFANQDEYHASFLKLINDKNALEKIYSDFETGEKKFKDFIKLVEKNGETYLHKNYGKFIRDYDAEYIPGTMIDGVMVYGERFFNEMRAKYPASEKELRILTAPWGQTFLNRYRQELLKIAIKYKPKKINSAGELLQNKEIKSRIEKVRNNFHWINNSYKNVFALPVSYFAGQLWELLQDDKTDYAKELAGLKSLVDGRKKECAHIKRQAIFESRDFEKLLWLAKIAWLIDRRKECNLIANYYIGKHLEWLCKKLGIVYEDALFLLPWELDNIIAGKNKINDFPVKERRVEGIFALDIYGNELFLTGDEAKKLWSVIDRPVAVSAARQIKGMVAFKGKVRGTVRVVMDASNPGEFNQGDILVTGMTRPDFLGLMKKTAAFVTDEGGITCHAAIVARELKIPCIVGTKVATKFLKNGDRVEVDAEKGLVRLI